jgi:putative ABC transport system permease protein
MKIIFTLAWRNLWRNRRRTLITISSILFAVLLAIVFFAIEKGTYERMIDSMVRYSTGYIQIQDVLYDEEPSIDNTLYFDEEIRGVLHQLEGRIDYYVPRLQNFSLVSAETVARGALITGMDPEYEFRLNDLRDDLTAGRFFEPEEDGIVIAKGLAEILGVEPGDTLVLLGQGFHGATAAGLHPIIGVVDLRIPDLNNNMIYMSLETAQWLYMAENRLTALIVMPENPGQTDQVAEALRQNLDAEWHQVLTWEVMLEDLLRLMEFDMAGTMVMLFILYVVIAFGLFGTILTMMIERQREFGLLFSLGMKRSKLAMMCFIETLILTIAGVAAGIAAAVPVITWFHYNPVRLSGRMAEALKDYGFEPIMPVSTDPQVFYQQALVVMLIAFVIGMYPVYKVFRIKIMEVKK